LDTPSKWFGVTYADDRPAVVEKLNDLIKRGEYPEKLFQNKNKITISQTKIKLKQC